MRASLPAALLVALARAEESTAHLRAPGAVPRFTLTQDPRHDHVVLDLAATGTRDTEMHALELIRCLLLRHLGIADARVVGQSATPDTWRVAYRLPRGISEPQLAAASDCVADWARRSWIDLAERLGLPDGECPFVPGVTDREPAALRRWAFSHYAAAGINDPDCWQEIDRAQTWAYAEVPAAAVPLRRDPVYLPAKIAAYAELLRRGVQFPPLLNRAGGHLREGYHRHAAHLLAGRDPVALVTFE